MVIGLMFVIFCTFRIRNSRNLYYYGVVVVVISKFLIHVIFFVVAICVYSFRFLFLWIQLDSYVYIWRNFMAKTFRFLCSWWKLCEYNSCAWTYIWTNKMIQLHMCSSYTWTIKYEAQNVWLVVCVWFCFATFKLLIFCDFFLFLFYCWKLKKKYVNKLSSYHGINKYKPIWLVFQFLLPFSFEHMKKRSLYLWMATYFKYSPFAYGYGLPINIGFF